MSRKDEYQYDYLDDNERFADQINGALFHGVQVVKADELEPADMQSVYLGREAGRRENYKTISDKTRMWRGGLLHIISLQNQSYADYRMVLRNMLSESIGYHKQWRRRKAVHERVGDLAPGTDAFFPVWSGTKSSFRLSRWWCTAGRNTAGTERNACTICWRSMRG